MWGEDGYLSNEKNGKVLAVHGKVDAENRYIGVKKRIDDLSQKFELIYADEYPEDPKDGEMDVNYGMRVGTPFHLVSGLKSGRYLDILGRNMVIKRPNGRRTQMWFYDFNTKTIKNFQNKGWSWDIAGSGRSNNMHAYNTHSKWWQLFKSEGKFFVNSKNGKVLDVAGGKDEEGNNVQVWKKNGSKAQ